MASIEPSIGSLVDKAKKLANERAALSAKDKALKAEFDDLKVQIMNLMKDQDTRVGEGKLARASIVVSEEPQVADWQVFLTYARKTNNLHLVQQRISSPAWREIRALKGKEIPGINCFIKHDLNLRAVGSKE